MTGYPRYRINPRLADILGQLNGTPLGQGLADRLAKLAEDAGPTPEGDELRAAVHPQLWPLDRVGTHGLPLTQAGYLKPVDVKAVAQVLPTMRDWIFPITQEVHARPVGAFHHHLRDVGLLRATKGTLQVTKAGRDGLNDPAQLWHQLASRLVTCRRAFDETAALLIALHAATTNGRIDTDTIALTLQRLGWSQSGGAPLLASDVQWLWNDLWGALGNVGSSAPAGRFDRTMSSAAVALVRDALLVRRV